MGISLYTILIGVAGLFAFIQTIRGKDEFARVITAFQVIAIGMTFIPDDTAISIGFTLYLISILLIIIYRFVKKGLSKEVRRTILTMTIPIFIIQLFVINQWPYAGYLGVGSVIAIISFLYLLKSKYSTFKNQIGFLTVLFIDAVIRSLITISFFT